MSDQVKLCPFRKDGDGFLQCYGAKCMAYLEYDQPIFQPLGEYKAGKEQKTVRATICRMMPPPPLYATPSCV